MNVTDEMARCECYVVLAVMLSCKSTLMACNSVWNV
jgi:hypothetical protein